MFAGLMARFIRCNVSRSKQSFSRAGTWQGAHCDGTQNQSRCKSVCIAQLRINHGHPFIMDNSLQGKNILVTGASRGIGQAIAVHCASLGANVAGLATRTSNLDATAAAIQELGGEFLGLEGDISLAATATDAIAAVIEKWGTLDGLVANAGITRDNLLLRMTQEDFDAVINTNLGGSFHLLKAATKPMLRNKGGSIIFIGSVVATTGNPGQANYCASKAGLHGLARSAAIELGSRNITVN
ncbi:MAG TPA: SDR family NAD(P)-dependent oxidoreductase [Planctomycetes bacterium]|nr:SDR family NAD(P)-dependent oxidoreductase [Planctomycetota bacterium]